MRQPPPGGVPAQRLHEALTTPRSTALDTILSAPVPLDSGPVPFDEEIAGVPTEPGPLR